MTSKKMVRSYYCLTIAKGEFSVEVSPGLPNHTLPVLNLDRNWSQHKTNGMLVHDTNGVIQILAFHTHFNTKLQHAAVQLFLVCKFENVFVMQIIKDELHPKSKLRCFARFLKIISTFLTNIMMILKQIVWKI